MLLEFSLNTQNHAPADVSAGKKLAVLARWTCLFISFCGSVPRRHLGSQKVHPIPARKASLLNRLTPYSPTVQLQSNTGCDGL